jgi:hypothetical protein
MRKAAIFFLTREVMEPQSPKTEPLKSKDLTEPETTEPETTEPEPTEPEPTETETTEPEPTETETTETETTETEAVEKEVEEVEEDICWICYDSEKKEIRRCCRCVGSVGKVHPECLLKWIDHSGKISCPQCRYEYVIKTEYGKNWHRYIDNKKAVHWFAIIFITILLSIFHWMFTRIFMSSYSKSPFFSSRTLTSLFTEIDILCLLVFLTALLIKHFFQDAFQEEIYAGLFTSGDYGGSVFIHDVITLMYRGITKFIQKLIINNIVSKKRTIDHFVNSKEKIQN